MVAVTPAGAERDRILREWNDTRADFPDACAHELFERQAARDPSATAVVHAGGRLTYRELNERANRIAHFLRRRGVKPDTLVGVSMHRTPLMVAALLGVWKAGGAYVPIDPAYPADRLAFLVDDAAVHVLLADAASRPLFPHREDKLVALDADWARLEGESGDDPSAAATPASLAYVIYTSGSTGKPKGALIEHRGLVNYLWYAIRHYGVAAGDAVPVHSSISFDLTVTSLFPALLAGGHVELVPEDAGAQSLVASLRDGKQRGLVKITPAHLELLNQQVGEAEAAGVTRAFIIGGEALTAESLRLWRQAAPRTRLINEYGPTETVVGCCIHEVRPEDPDRGAMPIGRPIANTELYVLDEALQPVGVGEMGELYIGGAGVARGYLNRPDLTAQRFLPDGFSGRPGARLYKTGDLARWRADGILEYLGRVDDQVKVHGYRIELGEIEATLAGQPDVRSATVLLREDTPGNKQLVGYVVPREGRAPSPEDLRRFLKERLPEYMVPAHFVALEAFPLTQNGKVDRRALPAPSYATASGAHAYTAPRTETERRLAALWTDLLKLDRVGIHDDVFDLGATSLMVVSAVSQLQAGFGVALHIQAVFENPTVEKMAAALDAARPKAAQPAAAPAVPSRAAQPAPAAAGDGRPLPIRFGPAGRELLGIYQPPTGGQDRRECCVLCNPFGQEAMRSHRAFRILAERLSRAGFHVLRFDFLGTGDSAGGDEDGNLTVWIGDVARASDEVVRRSSASAVTWFGLRLGASLAALASKAGARAPKRLVLWDPIADGAAYVRELADAHVAARKEAFGIRWESEARVRAQVMEEAKAESLGYAVTAELKAQLGALSPAAFRGARAGQVALIGARDAGAWSGLARELAAGGATVTTRAIAADIDWLKNDMLNDAPIAPDDLRTVVAAFTEDA